MKRYDVIVNGNATTLLLSDADAAARGLTVTPAEPAQPQDDSKAKTPANKARRPANKRRTAAAAEAFGAKDSEQ